MKFQNFDKNACQALRNEMNAVLKKFGIDSNLEFEVGNMRFSPTEVEVKIKAVVAGGESRADQALSAMANMLKLTLETRNNRKLVGYNSRSYKYPFVYLDLRDNKRYKCTEETAISYFKKIV